MSRLERNDGRKPPPDESTQTKAVIDHLGGARKNYGKIIIKDK